MPTLVVTLLCLVYAGGVLVRSGGDPMVFVRYDGHFSYQIAMRDFEDPDAIERLPQQYDFREDVPTAYRYQRVLYPLLARLLGAGQPSLIPWTLILLNIAAIAVGTYATELILATFGVSQWYALAYGLYGGQLLGLRTNLNEPLTFALVQLAILAWLDRRLVSSALAFALAILAKEVALIFLAAFVAYSLLARQWKWALVLSASVLPYLVYQAWLWRAMGEPGLVAGEPFSLIPFGGYLEAARISLPAFMLISIIIVPMSIIPMLLGIGLSLRSLLEGVVHPFVFAALFSSLFLAFLPFLTFAESSAMLRVTQGLALSLLLLGALIKSGRVLNYSLFWVFTNVLLVKGA
jgi:hypothetical protein